MDRYIEMGSCRGAVERAKIGQEGKKWPKMAKCKKEEEMAKDIEKIEIFGNLMFWEFFRKFCYGEK